MVVNQEGPSKHPCRDGTGERGFGRRPLSARRMLTASAQVLQMDPDAQVSCEGVRSGKQLLGSKSGLAASEDLQLYH